MRYFPLAVLLAVFCACRADNAVTTASPAETDFAFREPSGAFELRGPAGWRLRNDSFGGPNVMLVGPGAASIGVARYPNGADRSPDPRRYHSDLSLVPENRAVSGFKRRVVAGQTAFAYSFERPRRPLHARTIDHYVREDVVVFPFKGGFYRLHHAASTDTYRKTLPAFEAVVASFKPNAPAAADAP